MKSRPKNKGKKFVPHQKKRKLSVVSPEVLFAQKLAANDPVQRNRAVKKLQKWLQLRGSLLTKEEIMRIWKGLHYCFWMSDKPLIQEELAETIGIVLFLIYQLKFISPLCANILQLKERKKCFWEGLVFKANMPNICPSSKWTLVPSRV